MKGICKLRGVGLIRKIFADSSDYASRVFPMEKQLPIIWWDLDELCTTLCAVNNTPVVMAVVVVVAAFADFLGLSKGGH